MNEATIEVPVQDAEKFLSWLKAGYKDGAARYANEIEGAITLPKEKREQYLEELERACRFTDESRPLIAQGIMADTSDPDGAVTYTGSTYVLADTAENILRDYIDALHELGSVSPGEFDQLRCLLRYVESWIDECERLEAIDREAEGAVA